MPMQFRESPVLSSSGILEGDLQYGRAGVSLPPKKEAPRHESTISPTEVHPMKFLVLLFALLPTSLFAADSLDIYWIDVEGGAATLIVTPGGDTVLVDAGWPGFEGRDMKRIKSVLGEQAKASKIDYFITSHFHRDHVGGLPQLAAEVPIGKFVDHGDSVEQERPNGMKLWQSYLSVAKGKRMTAKPGDELPLSGAGLTFVTARSRVLDKPLKPSGPNPLCNGAKLMDEDTGENGKSVGFILSRGGFEFLDIGDLTWNVEHTLGCPENLLGEIDLYQVTHHGLANSGAPQHLWATKPRVAVMNNGPRKGGAPEAFETISKSPGLEDIWQVHRSLETDDAHNTNKKMIANFEETDDCKGHWIKASVAEDGSYTITNGRNNFSKTYKAR